MPDAQLYVVKSVAVPKRCQIITIQSAWDITAGTKDMF